MLITICNQTFDTNEIESLSIRDGRVLIDTAENFYNLRWYNKEDIKEAEAYLKFRTLTRKELMEAVNIIMVTCDYFINEKEQCKPCPLKKKDGCIFEHAPIDWRE